MWSSSVERMCCLFSKDAKKPAEISLTYHKVTDNSYLAALATALISLYLQLFPTQILASPFWNCPIMWTAQTEYLLFVLFFSDHSGQGSLVGDFPDNKYILNQRLSIFFHFNTLWFLYGCYLGQVSLEKEILVSMRLPGKIKGKTIKNKMRKASTLEFRATENRQFNYADRTSEDQSHCAVTLCLHVGLNLKKSRL